MRCASLTSGHWASLKYVIEMRAEPGSVTQVLSLSLHNGICCVSSDREGVRGLSHLLGKTVGPACWFV